MRGLDKMSDKYVGYESKVNTLKSSLEQLKITTKEYNDLLSDLNFVRVDEALEGYASQLDRLNSKQEVDEAKGGTKTNAYYESAKEIIQDEITTAQDGMNEAMNQLKDMFGNNLMLNYQNIINTALTGDFSAAIFKDMDTNRIKKLSEDYVKYEG